MRPDVALGKLAITSDHPKACISFVVGTTAEVLRTLSLLYLDCRKIYLQLQSHMSSLRSPYIVVIRNIILYLLLILVIQGHG